MPPTRELRPKRELLTLLRRLNDCVGVSARHVYTQQTTVPELLQRLQSDIRRQLPELCAFIDSLLPSTNSWPSSLVRRAFRHPDAQWLSRSARESGISALVCQQLVRLAKRDSMAVELTIHVLLDALLSSCAQRLGQSPDACKWRPTQPKPRFHAMTCFPVWSALLPFAALMGLRFPDTFLKVLKEYRALGKKKQQVNCDFAQVTGVWRLVGELNRGDTEKQSEVTMVMTELLTLMSDKLLIGLIPKEVEKRMGFHLYDQLLDKFFTGLQEFSFTIWRANAVLKPALLDALKSSLKVPEDRTKELVVPQRVAVFTAAGSMLVKDLAPEVVAMVVERIKETPVVSKNPLLQFLVGFCAHLELVPLKSVMVLLELLLEAYKTDGCDVERRELVFYIAYVAVHRCESVDRLQQDVSSDAADIKEMLSQLQLRLCSDIAFEDLYVAAPVHWTAKLWQHWVFLSDEQVQCFVSEAEENDNDTEEEFKERVEGWHALHASVAFKPASFSSFTQMKALLKPHLIAPKPLADENEPVAPARKRRRTEQEPVDPAQLERSFDVLLLPDVMERVCSFMSAKRLCRMALVCRTFADISHRASLWKPLYMRVGIPVGKKQLTLPPAPVFCQHGEVYEHNWRQLYQERSKVLRRLRRMQLRAIKANELSELESVNSNETSSSSRLKPFVPLMCSYCGCNQVLKSENELEAHQKLHKRFTCTETTCRASFFGLHKFNAHMKEHPEAKSRLLCGFDGCEKTYTSAKWLANHRQKEGHHTSTS
ncbi:hypothetical protein P3T76_009623 [Phytophthora citrophthora]|uniref:C2H2-type domain-containing protein n=1 Tax=Phytophthora citrophthora TaxID=4793 RepID=A0AAD9GG50_9STRA|nr:hypothetical protein P3T76_009623 [Phytophthora citrophthora]